MILRLFHLLFLMHKLNDFHSFKALYFLKSSQSVINSISANLHHCQLHPYILCQQHGCSVDSDLKLLQPQQGDPALPKEVWWWAYPWWLLCARYCSSSSVLGHRQEVLHGHDQINQSRPELLESVSSLRWTCAILLLILNMKPLCIYESRHQFPSCSMHSWEPPSLCWLVAEELQDSETNHYLGWMEILLTSIQKENWSKCEWICWRTNQQGEIQDRRACCWLSLTCRSAKNPHPCNGHVPLHIRWPRY